VVAMNCEKFVKMSKRPGNREHVGKKVRGKVFQPEGIEWPVGLWFNRILFGKV
jgi:hypothetical protein